MIIKTAAIDVGIFTASNIIALLNPIVYSVLWIAAIVFSKTMFTHEQRRGHTYLKALVVAAPIGVLTSMICIENGMGLYSANGIGALVAICADKIFLGGWFDKIIDAGVDVFKSRFSK